MIFTNARLIFPDGIRDGLEVVVEEGKIAAIQSLRRSYGGRVSRTTRRRLLISMEIILRPVSSISMCTAHLATTRWKHRLKRSAPFAISMRVAARHRFCSLQQRPLSTKSSRSCKRFAILDQTSRAIAGVHVEGPFISKAKAGAQRAEFIQDPSPAAVRQLLEYTDVMKRVTIAPELPGALERSKIFTTRGISVSGGHSDAWDEDARAAFDRGMRSVTHTFNCMSSARAPRNLSGRAACLSLR